MEIVLTPIQNIRPYENNPRINDAAVKAVAESIREFGWKQPIVVDQDGVIIAGHTRYKAALMLGYDAVPIHYANDLTPDQVAAYRLADNKTHELSLWDTEKLEQEVKALEEIDLSLFGFKVEDAEAFSYIDALLEEEFSSTNHSKQYFDVTFTFGIEHYERVQGYIRENGKDGLVALLINHMEENQ